MIFYPRDSFDEKGLSITPPVIDSRHISSEELYNNSLSLCINEFITIVKHTGVVNSELFQITKEVVSVMIRD